jgi:Tfp pilus assembly protein PilF
MRRLLAVIGVLVPVGCQSLPLVGNGDPPPLSVKADAPATSAAPAELPPEQAAQVCLATARELEKSGYQAEAIRGYEKARQADPRLAGVARRLAVLYDKQGDHSRAAVEYHTALQQAPHDADLLCDFGYFHYERGDYDEAEKWLRKSIEAKPEHQKAWVNLGLTLGRRGREAESIEAFTKVVPPAQAHYNLGMVLGSEGRTEEAKKALRQALALDPDLRPARAALAKLEEK